MPTYDYKCFNCGCCDEQIHGMRETPDIICPDCDAKMAKIPSKDVQFFGNFKGFFDMGAKRWINSKQQIRDIEQREGKIHGGVEELDQEADRISVQKKQETRQKIDAGIRESVRKSIDSGRLKGIRKTG